MLAVIAFALLPLFAFTALRQLSLSIAIPTFEYTPTLIALYTSWLICAWMALFGVWTNYYLDVWTITNKRLISVDQRGLFHRNTGSFRLERLQDINVSVRGILATFLDYGDLQAETASEDRDFVARAIPKPQELKALILGATDKITYSKPQEVPQRTEVQ
jgi:uncharacterized membrane protein YdbT with pleckstrin-like domain